MTSSQALGPIQRPMQWVLGALSPEVKRPGREANHSPPSSAEVKHGGPVPPSPLLPHDVVLNKLSPGINLPLLLLSMMSFLAGWLSIIEPDSSFWEVSGSSYVWVTIPLVVFAYFFMPLRQNFKTAIYSKMVGPFFTLSSFAVFLSLSKHMWGQYFAIKYDFLLPEYYARSYRLEVAFDLCS
jgi:hypothetical protein